MQYQIMEPEYLVVKNYRNGDIDYMKNPNGLFMDKFIFPTLDDAKDAIKSFLGKSKISHKRVLLRSNQNDIVAFEIRCRHTSRWKKIR
jgi:hypothetical protein